MTNLFRILLVIHLGLSLFVSTTRLKKDEFLEVSNKGGYGILECILNPSPNQKYTKCKL